MRSPFASARDGFSLVVLLLLATGPALAQEAPRALIERAIRAHGGQERLARARADRVKMKGTLVVGTTKVPFVSETTVQLPGQFKSVVQVTGDGKTHTVVHLLDGERSTVFLDGKEQELPATTRAQMRQTLDLEQAMRLVPLLTSPAFKLAPAGEMKLNDRPTVVLLVTVGGQRELKLSFDKASALLVKSEHTVDGPGGKKVRQEAYYGNYRDVDGYRRPGQVVAFRDGKRVMDAELVEVKSFARLGPAEFSRP